ncbi:head maturation protease, ClpP-related [Erysipelothrix anatis]|uniref:head maturation protease, ClpP-related n=1 Tax=Erysipelothrix anatis TaxID=2683713 RepID=UPI00135A7803|nr:head maturation protease, ClpP-related [Erysipelothrix anatis]
MNDVMQFKQKNETTTEMYVYGEIRKKGLFEMWFGDDETRTGAFDIKDALEKVTTPNLTVRINSMGGSVSEGLAIYNLLESFEGEVTTIIDGFACSAASIIFMAGSKRIAPESSLLMIHNAWSSVSGDSNALEKAAEDLKKITQPSLNIYTSKSNLKEDEIKLMMDKETWITPQESYDWGFSTTIDRNEAKQSIGDEYFKRLIIENKSLQQQLNEISLETVEQPLQNANGWEGFFS